MNNKKQRIILKNTGKYNVLRLAKGIDLGQFMHYSANYNIPFNYDKVSDWVYTDDGRVYFKSGESLWFAETQKQRIVNELLYDNLAMQLGMWTAKYEPATFEDLSSLISHDILEFADLHEEVKTIGNYMNLPTNYTEVGLDQILSKWDRVPEFEGYSCDKEDLLFKMYRMIVLDAITFQEDRHDDNIHIFVDDQNKTIRFAPIIDNEYAFAAKTLNKFFELSRSGMIDNFDEKEFLLQHGKRIRLTIKKDTYKLPDGERYKQNVKDIVELASQKPRLKAFLVDALKCVDINQAIESVEKKGYVLTDDYKQYLKDTIRLSKKIFAQCIKEYKETHETQHEGEGCGKE